VAKSLVSQVPSRKNINYSYLSNNIFVVAIARRSEPLQVFPAGARLPLSGDLETRKEDL
jgi:hypothetical protein